MNVDPILQALREMCDQDLGVQTAPVDEVFIVLPAARLHQAVELLIDRFDVYHLSTITAQDVDGQIELLYHFWHGGGLTLRTSVPRTDAHIATLIDLIPGIAYYEREVSEMLHVTFDGHPDPRPLLLPDDWSGEAPLRSEFSSTAAGRDER